MYATCLIAFYHLTSKNALSHYDTNFFFFGESQGRGSLVGCRLCPGEGRRGAGEPGEAAHVLLIAVKWSLVFTTGLHNSDTLYTYALVHAANISIFPSLMGDGGNPEFPGPLTDPGSFPHAAPLLEEGGRPPPPACTTHLWPPWRTWAP